MPVNFKDYLSPQWEAGTGRKRNIPYSGVMAGSAAYAPEEAKLNKLTEIENERIDLITEQFNKSKGLERDARKDAESEAKKASIIQGVGTVGQGAYVATRPEIKELIGGVKGIFSQGAAPTQSGMGVAISEPATELGTGIGMALSEPIEGYGAGVAADYLMGDVAAESALAGSEGALAGASWYAAPVAAAFLADQFLNEGRVAETITEAVEDVGSFIGGIFDDCIIVTACNGKDSSEVDITRRYRDEFMSREAVRGYYMIAEKVVPVMNESKAIKESIKKELVDRLIEYGKFRLGESDRCSADAERISLKFLADCERVGKTIDSYIRVNGEEV
jgi:hypothetical protein